MGYEEDGLSISAAYSVSPEVQSAEAMRIGRLHSRHISASGRNTQTYYVIERYTREFKGMGWYVLDAPTHADDDKPNGIERIGLMVSGFVFEFDSVVPASYHRGKTILHAANFDRFQGSDAIRLMESEPFKMGVASLIAGHGPYHHDEYL